MDIRGLDVYQARFDHLRLIIEQNIYMWPGSLIRQQILSTVF
ncbi:shiga-like toxin 2 subunit A domain protein [Escherichia coli 09BKT076207]|nr:shiga-like toxin 2 subunit A domain protein [Escherichia coli 09BKT076207]